MIKANISNNDIIHNGDFGVNICINHPVINLSISDFLLESLSGNGVNNLLLPETLDITYTAEPVQTLLMIPIELPHNVDGSFRVYMQDKLYTVDNRKLDILPNSVGLPSTEKDHINCEPKIFEYNTGI